MSLELEKTINGAISIFEDENGIRNFWEPPLLAAMSANHPLIPGLKQAVSPDHLLPDELLPGAKSVVVYFIPLADRIIESNMEGELASEEWALSYVITNSLLGFIKTKKKKTLAGSGFQAAKIKATHNFDKETLMSRWSHRHLAWIAGLGSFGLNNMLITSKGCCGRFGSLVTDADCGELGVHAASGPQKERCLNKINGSCGICRTKCPAGAYGEDGKFDRHKCYEVCLKNAGIHKSTGMADVCGKCLVGLPCSKNIPYYT
jgi:epoxyqueuosine reductase QueG